MSRQFHDGKEDGLEPLEPLDVRGADNISDLLRGMSKTAFGGRNLGEAYEVLLAMARDPDCRIIVTVSGAMTVAKMGLVLCEMINAGLAHYIVSTGALMAHGLTEAMGRVHYKHDPTHNDSDLYEKGYNRVYDTLEMESNMDDAQDLMESVLDDLDTEGPTCSYRVNEAIGKRLSETGQMPSVLGCAYEKGVKVYVPAFTDSELGLNTSAHALGRYAREHSEADAEELLAGVPAYNPFLDLHDCALSLMKAERLGIFTIGGGVPRNWAQQVAPFIECVNRGLKKDFRVPRIHYGVRICPEPVHWGGLSGCTYSEGVSWGKFVPREEGGRFAEVYCDATIAWPLLIKAVLEGED